MAHASCWSTTLPPRRPTALPPTTCTSEAALFAPTLHTLVHTASSLAPLLIRAKYADCSKLDVPLTVTAAAASPHPSSINTESDGEANDNNNTTTTTMSKGRGERRSSTTKTVDSLRQSKTPTSTSSPVQIPRQSSRTGTNRDKHHASQRRRNARDVHSPDAVSPSVAALLAMTDIPRHRQSIRQKRKAEASLTVQDIVQSQHVSEKELSLSLTGNPLDLLLSPPEDLPTEDDMSTTCESPDGFSLRHTVSYDSVPSLGDSYATDPASSFDSSPYFAREPTRRTRSPVRKSLGPVRSPPHVLSDEHPLSIRLEDDEFPLSLEPTEEPPMSVFSEPFKPLKAAFKSNLTASLRALRSAAKSFSSINFPITIPPDDLLSRSILTIDPSVPYTDERRPPVTEEMPSAELRRYLNPTTRPLEAQQPQDRSGPQQRPRLASIQMQTYKVHRARVTQAASRSSPTSALPPTGITSTTGAGAVGNGGPTAKADHPQQQQTQKTILPAAMRQREIRENPDFIRIAVMEMAMRRQGKLDDRKPGRARWALPPRKAPIKSSDVEEIGPNGVPARWIPISYEQ
ncbi:hypothetical protein ISF_01073 [Cordyceps fumosorosea ARSEF 2679]|uniref:Uncharacterized protein n=1 Tax=Cordyceps fumosorosea (strain ARSEF 2679) TaxID=1081104 RepID=A0A162JV30_CORFA|nr:hypothetical protein ISF_01073 [Cordyceps fumosorosea ARSEF 2679]OAA74172.1 hypothetical protein ISF_01073 [Cordyceps fumosorosea ARSEF 2679]